MQDFYHNADGVDPLGHDRGACGRQGDLWKRKGERCGLCKDKGEYQLVEVGQSGDKAKRRHEVMQGEK